MPARLAAACSPCLIASDPSIWPLCAAFVDDNMWDAATPEQSPRRHISFADADVAMVGGANAACSSPLRTPGRRPSCFGHAQSAPRRLVTSRQLMSSSPGIAKLAHVLGQSSGASKGDAKRLRSPAQADTRATPPKKEAPAEYDWLGACPGGLKPPPPPPWEMVFYTLVTVEAEAGLREQMLNVASQARGGGGSEEEALRATITAAKFPEDALGLGGDRVINPAATALLEPVVQALRTLAKSPELLRDCVASPGTWTLHDVRPSVANFFVFLWRQRHAKTKRDKGLLPKGKLMRWNYYRTQWSALLLDAPLRYVLASQLVRCTPQQPLAALGINRKAWSQLRVGDFSLSSAQPISAQPIFANLLGELSLCNGKKSKSLVQRKPHKYVYRSEPGTYFPFFTPLSKEEASPTVSQGDGVKFRIPIRWEAVRGRVGKILLCNTRKVHQTGLAHSTICRWLGIGSGAPSRDWVVAYGDWGLQSTHMRAVVMARSALNVALGRPVATTAAAATSAAPSPLDDGDAPPPAPPPPPPPVERPELKTVDSVRTWLSLRRRTLGALRMVCYEWDLKRLPAARSKQMRLGAQIVGDTSISQMNADELERVLLWRAKELETAIADAGSSAAGAARAAAPTAAARRPQMTAAQRVQAFGKALERQSMPAEPPVLLPAWSPLDDEVCEVLGSCEARQRSLLVRYYAELRYARSEMSYAQRLKFACRWHDVAVRKVERLELTQQGYPQLCDEAGAYQKETLAAPTPVIRALLQAKATELSARAAAKQRRLAELVALRHRLLSSRAAVADGLDLAMGAAGAAATSTAETAAETAADPDPDPPAFPDLKNMHQLLGPLHFFKMGLIQAIYKMYFFYLLSYVAHDLLGLKHIALRVTNFYSSDELFYHTSEALLVLMIVAYRESPMYRKPFSAEDDNANFVAWLSAGIDSGDVPFRFYSGFVFGPGLLYRSARQAISCRDVLMLFALLLPTIGLFRITGAHNLRKLKQGFLTIAKVLTSFEAVARYLLANWCLPLTGRALHALGADELLEHMIGRVKQQTGKVWNPTTAKVHSALNFFLNDIRDQMVGLVGLLGKSSKPKGVHHKHAQANIQRIVDKFAPLNLFRFDAAAPRTELPAELVAKDAKPLPAAYVLPIRFDKPLSNAMPVFQQAAAVAQEILEACGVVPPGGAAAVPAEVIMPQQDPPAMLGCAGGPLKPHRRPVRRPSLYGQKHCAALHALHMHHDVGRAHEAPVQAGALHLHHQLEHQLQQRSVSVACQIRCAHAGSDRSIQDISEG